ncbi:MAG: Gfo/Idh/MocA family oxidoreductase [bacterium]|nr:Gfo/Idh/MocA family oxidoreductase [bacterium]
MIKFGIIGCGGIGKTHTKILKKFKDVEIISACDINEIALLSFQKEFEVKEIYSDYKELIRKSNIDAIICATPTHLHHDIVVEAAKFKKQIFCEKPIALNIKDAEDMINECEKNNVILQIGYVRRFDEEWVKFKELIENKTIGRPVIWHQIWGGFTPPDEWFYDIKRGMGPFVDGAVHSYDFAIYTFGEVKNVKSSLLCFKNYTSPDTGCVSVEFESSDILVLCWSWGLPKNVYCEHVHQVLGPKGVLIFGGEIKDDWKYFLIRRENGIEKIGPIPLNSLAIAYEKQLLHFIDCIKNNKKPVVTGLDGIKSLKVGLEAIKSFIKD